MASPATGPSLAQAPEISLTALTQYTAYDHAEATSDCIAMVNVCAPPYQPQFRCKVDIVAVIDRSGSMEGKKLDLVKKSLIFIIDQLKHSDRFCLVLFDDQVDLQFPLTRMTSENKKMVKSKVSKITPRGTTNLCGGLLKGMEQIILRDDEQKAMVASVLLFTDGLANYGVCTCEEIITAMHDPIESLIKSKASRNILFPFYPQLQSTMATMVKNIPSRAIDFKGTIYTFGFGSDHNEDLLSAISNVGNGMYYFINSTDEITEYFADCFGGILSVVGQNIELTIEAQPCCTLGTVHYRNKPKMEPDSKTCVILLGDLQCEENRNIIIPLKLEELKAECVAQPLIKVTLSYLNVINTLLQTISVYLSVDRKSMVNLEPDESVTEHLLRVQVALTLQEAKKASSSPQNVKVVLKKAKILTESVPSTTQIHALQDDIKKMEGLSNDENVRKRLSSFEQETLGQRKNSSTRLSSCGYDTTARFLMRRASMSSSMK